MTDRKKYIDDILFVMLLSKDQIKFLVQQSSESHCSVSSQAVCNEIDEAIKKLKELES